MGLGKRVGQGEAAAAFVFSKAGWEGKWRSFMFYDSFLQLQKQSAGAGLLLTSPPHCSDFSCWERIFSTEHCSWRQQIQTSLTPLILFINSEQIGRAVLIDEEGG